MTKEDHIQSLLHVLDKYWFPPVLVKVVGDAKLCNEFVLKDKKIIFILERNVDPILFGTDLSGKKFRFNICNEDQLLVDHFEEFYPKSLDEMKVLKPAYILSKLSFTYESQVYEKNTIFNYNVNKQFQNNGYFSLITLQGQTISLLLEILLSKMFSFVCYVKTSTLEVLLKHGVESKIVRFRKEHWNVPVGIATLNELRFYETILAVSKNNKCSEVYEKFQLDSRINVVIPKNVRLPNYIKALGDYNTASYCDKIKNIQRLMNHEIYFGQYYGYYHTGKNRANEINFKIKRHDSLHKIEKQKHLRLKKRFSAIKKQFYFKKKHSL